VVVGERVIHDCDVEIVPIRDGLGAQLSLLD
jgi:hypothetical protein